MGVVTLERGMGTGKRKVAAPAVGVGRAFVYRDYLEGLL